MTIDLTGLVRPHLVEMTKREDDPNAAEFRLQPLERGFGYTLGNGIRRMLLSSLRGAAVWAFRMDGVQHEHQTVTGVVEDVHQIIQRLKALTLVLVPEVDEATLHIKRTAAGPVYARDIEAHGSIRVVNPDHLLFTLQDDRDLAMELYVNKGRGYLDADLHPVDRAMPVDVVRIDSIYSPVKRANFTVTETRVGQRTDFDKLTLMVRTDGSMKPDEAVSHGARILIEHISLLANLAEEAGLIDVFEPTETAATAGLDTSISELDLNVRAYNCLQRAKIETLADLVSHTEDELLGIRNLGAKTVELIKEKLQTRGLSLKSPE